MVETRILNAADPSHISDAAQVLRDGGIVAFPTETVYGLGADASNPLAVARIFEAKRRPAFDPLIVHVSSPGQALTLWKEVPESALLLIRKFWPGPLTLVLPKNDKIPDIVTAGLPTVAVRMPKNDAALRLIESLGSPIAAPSANLFGYTSATTAAAVAEDLGNKIDIILDGGPATVGIESTVIKIDKNGVVLLRPGGIPIEEIRKLVPVIEAEVPEEGAPESPGQLASHYAPWTKFMLMDKDFTLFLSDVEALHAAFVKKNISWPRIGLLIFSQRPGTGLFEAVELLSSKRDIAEAAANLFQAIRKLDKMHLDVIIAESFNESGLGFAIMDRLKKAASGQAGAQAYFGNLLEGQVE